jgi:hypothetical protein
MEQLAKVEEADFANLDIDSQERLWQAVKASERGKTT